MMKRILILLALLCVTGSVFAQTGKMTPPIARHNTGKMSAKKLPPRDPRTGRFMKKPTGKMAMRKMPMRDSKGRFMKKPTGKMAMKRLPIRDSKGRFMKSKGGTM